MRSRACGLWFCLLTSGATLAADFPTPFVDPFPRRVTSSAQLAPALTPVPLPLVSKAPALTMPLVQARQAPDLLIGPMPQIQKPSVQVSSQERSLAQRQLALDEEPISSAFSDPAAQVHAVAIDLVEMEKAHPEYFDDRAKNCLYRTDIRYFTLYGSHPTRRREVRDAMFFTINSLSARRPRSVRPELVPGTGGLLYRIYLRNYHWSPEAWDKVAKTDPFFLDPWISDTPENAKGSKYMFWWAGKAIMRADWFVDATTDTNRNSAYYDLLYSQVHVNRNGKKICLNGQPPANDAEFRDAWFVNLDLLQEVPIDKGALVPGNTSLVAFNNRIVWRVPSFLQYYWQTFDVKKPVGVRDFVENRFPLEWDASEYITRMPNGLQAYLLSNGQGKRVEFADPFGANEQKRELNRHSVAVRTSQSCIVCHAKGIITPRDLISEILAGGTNLKELRRKVADRETDFYLSGTDLDALEDQFAYAKAVAACNGLSTDSNARGFANTINLYRDPVVLEQAARECGTTVATLQAALSYGGRGLLNHMATQGVPIPRDTWDGDHKNPGLFGEAMLLVLEWKKHPLTRPKGPRAF